MAVTGLGFLYLLDAASLLGARLRSGWLRALALRAESAAARPRWSAAELAALDDAGALEDFLGDLPEWRREVTP
jgi:hypothetical protein